MRFADRVRIARGEHQGRVGTVVDPAQQIARLRATLLHSPTRDALERKMNTPEGCYLVQLDGELGTRGRHAECLVFSEGCLIPVAMAVSAAVSR